MLLLLARRLKVVTSSLVASGSLSAEISKETNAYSVMMLCPVQPSSVYLLFVPRQN